MDRLSYSIAKNYRLSVRLKLKDAVNEFEKAHFLKHAKQEHTQSWNRITSGLTELIKYNRPLSYLLRTHQFLNCKISITNGLLVPRSETEDFVNSLIHNIRRYRIDSNEKFRILDIGCGTGCISIAMAANLKRVHVTSIDISSKACLYTQKNILNNLGLILKNDSAVNIIQADIFDDFDMGSFDLIVSNPPYIPKWRRKQVQPSVLRHEDNKALFPRSNRFNGLLFHERILELSKNSLNDRDSNSIPKIVLEFDGAYQVKALKKLLDVNSLKEFCFRRDCFNRIRTLWVY